ncbi:hypothetical protein BZG36_04863, partial [Bifiguratus adelaidae]
MLHVRQSIKQTSHVVPFIPLDNRPTPPSRDGPIEVWQAWELNTSPATSDAVPNIVHFVYGLRDPEPELDMIHYFAIQSAHDVLKPDIIYFHYHYLPKSVDIPTMIFDRSIQNYAHRADIVRLEALLEFGGIYLDMDILVLKSFESLMQEQVVMGQEGRDGWLQGLGRYASVRSHSVSKKQVLYTNEAGYLYFNVPTQQSAATFGLEWWMDTSMTVYGAEANPIMTMVMKEAHLATTDNVTATSTAETIVPTATWPIEVNATVYDIAIENIYSDTNETMTIGPDEGEDAKQDPEDSAHELDLPQQELSEFQEPQKISDLFIDLYNERETIEEVHTYYRNITTDPGRPWTDFYNMDDMVTLDMAIDISPNLTRFMSDDSNAPLVMERENHLSLSERPESWHSMATSSIWNPKHRPFETVSRLYFTPDPNELLYITSSSLWMEYFDKDWNRLDDALNKPRVIPIYIPPATADMMGMYLGPEDPRLLLDSYNNTLVFFNMNTMSGRRFWYYNVTNGHQVMFQSPNDQDQKNWTPIIFDNELYFIYNLQPLMVLKCASGTGRCSVPHLLLLKAEPETSANGQKKIKFRVDFISNRFVLDYIPFMFHYMDKASAHEGMLYPSIHAEALLSSRFRELIPFWDGNQIFILSSIPYWDVNAKEDFAYVTFTIADKYYYVCRIRGLSSAVNGVIHYLTGEHFSDATTRSKSEDLEQDMMEGSDEETYREERPKRQNHERIINPFDTGTSMMAKIQSMDQAIADSQRMITQVDGYTDTVPFAFFIDTGGFQAATAKVVEKH